MRRRNLMTVLAGAAAYPLFADAQQKPMPVIGYLFSGSPIADGPFSAAFRQGLSDTGYAEGQNVAIERRFADGRLERLSALAADLVSRKVGVIVAVNADSMLAAKNATTTIPIVFIGVDDPVAAGLVANFARPGGNLTGFSTFAAELMAKRLELLSELVPQARVIALLVNPDNPNTERAIEVVRDAAGAKGVQLQVLRASNEGEIDAAFATLVRLQIGGLLVGPTVVFFIQREQIFALASRYAVPAMYDTRLYVAAGGLISYGPSLVGMWRQVGVYVGKLLDGAKPADLPVQQPTTFELVI